MYITLSQADLQFLKFVSNAVGIPHYFDSLSDFGVNTEIIADKNIFVYTPERFLSFVEKKHQASVDIDFAFVDEVYKIDGEYILDDQVIEDERDVSYRMAIFYALIKNSDVLLAGPYIEAYSKSFRRFLTLR